ncbi:MAG: DUF2917 domain-containing protein [Comamonadaceae bacterium]|nr:MAG: DUF2917 domain-containing protein [Comamonadaceae bacterium]
MTASNVLNLQQSSASGRVAAQDVCVLVAGSAQSLRPRIPMSLRVMSGRAWVTLDDGPNGASDQAAGDLFLHAGQTLWVAAGQHAVVEPLGGETLQFRWRASSAVASDGQRATGKPWLASAAEGDACRA